MAKPHDSKGPKTNGYTRNIINVKLNRKRQEAQARQAAYSRLSLAEKLASLVPGGSKKQRAKLEARMNNSNVSIPAIKPAVAPVEPAKAKKTSKKKVVAEAKAKRPAKS